MIQPEPSVKFEFIDKYRTHRNKQEIRDLIERNADYFIASLAIWKRQGILGEKVKTLIGDEESLLLMRYSGHLIGMARLVPDDIIPGFEHFNKNLRISTIIIDPQFRGRGLGHYLYSEIDHHNKMVFRSPIMFQYTWESNKVQLHMYQKYGFQFLRYCKYPDTPEIKRLLYGKIVVLD